MYYVSGSYAGGLLGVTHNPFEINDILKRCFHLREQQTMVLKSQLLSSEAVGELHVVDQDRITSVHAKCFLASNF